MPRQLDMFKRGAVPVKPPSGRMEPRLWVRRVMIWSDPNTVVQDVTLRPGVNIIWSPDPRDVGRSRSKSKKPRAVGHGSGKTLFCRLVRYCLGEDRFAPLNQRDAIASAFRDGFVGAEVVLDGTTWAVVRSIGHRRRHVAIEDGSLEGALATTGPAPGIEALVAAIVGQVVGADSASLMPGPRDSAWAVELAWLARDQECRFGHVLDWRALASESDSPVRDFTRLQTLTALRVAIGAIDRAEHEHVRQTVSAEVEAKRDEEDLRHMQWDIARLGRRLSSVLGLAEDLATDAIGIVALRGAAAQRLDKAAGVDKTPGVATDLEARRRNANSVRTRAEELATQLAACDAAIPLRERAISKIEAEIPGGSARLEMAKKPVCPICEVPIDRALAEGCKLSDKLANPEQLRAQWDARMQELERERTDLAEARVERERLRRELGDARAQVGKLDEEVRRLEAALDAGRAAWLESRRLADDVERLAESIRDEVQVRGRLAASEAKVEQMRDVAGAFRQQKAPVFQTLSGHFDALVQALAGEGARGDVTLTAKGLQLAVILGGDRNSPAIDSLKVIAFDLAVLAMSIEEKTHVPAFLIHDSPREADLGLSIYERLFETAVALEKVGPAPLFQYIITTTTRPPTALAKAPWLRLTLRGAPPEDRLFGRDL
jgi:hypothetical protein